MDLESIRKKTSFAGNIGCVGCGTMGGAIIKAIASRLQKACIYVSAAHLERAENFVSHLEKSYPDCNAFAVRSNFELAQKCDVIFIAVKPNYVNAVLEEMKPAFTQKKIIVSMAAGVTLASLCAECGENLLSAPENNFAAPVLFRIMPNLPAVFAESMTALCAGKDAGSEDVELVKSLLSCAGKVEQVSEKLMDGVTAISGSGPAYAFMFIEALADAAVKFGIPRKQAYVYAAQTLKGSAIMALEDDRSISELKDAVCSPAGTTIEAVASLERSGFRAAVIDAACAAFKRSAELGKK